jgi:uncharacterized HAD superfamily protein
LSGCETILEYQKTFIIIFLIVFIIHIITYYFLSRNREYGYLRSNIIGVDIDGVLNKHREMFCDVLYKNTGKKLDPGSIKHIPVHESNLGVTREEELGVFNSPDYWIDMPVRDGIKSNIDKLRNSLNFDIMVFTYRPWPEFKEKNSKTAKDTIKKWESCVKNILISESRLTFFEKKKLILKYYFFMLFNHKRFVDIITYCWLKNNGINFKKLTIEKGTENIEHVKTKYENRFKISGNKLIRFFVEDDYEKAIRLSYICDIVFLIKHPYNSDRTDLPRPDNVIPVDGWTDIYKKIRLL